jgi:hypothetical protein
LNNRFGKTIHPGKIVSLRSVVRLLVTVNVVHSSPILLTLIMEEIVPLKFRFLQEPHGIIPKKTEVSTVTPVKTSNLT